MKKIILAIAVLITTLTSCDYIKNYDKAHLELHKDIDYKLSISNFDWGYGRVAINQFNGDFDRLDAKVFDLLKGKEGGCLVYMENASKDKYGKENTTFELIGTISLSELNKYQSWEYWAKEAGIKVLLYQKYIASKEDSEPAVIEMITNPDSLIRDSIARAEGQNTQPTPQTVATPKPVTKSYSFSFEDLYPNPNDRNFDENRRQFEGTISEVNFANGVMVVNSNTGEEMIIQFYPLDASSYTFNQLRLAIKPGNKISGVIARAGASTVDLISLNVASI